MFNFIMRAGTTKRDYLTTRQLVDQHVGPILMFVRGTLVYIWSAKNFFPHVADSMEPVSYDGFVQIITGIIEILWENVVPKLVLNLLRALDELSRKKPRGSEHARHRQLFYNPFAPDNMAQDNPITFFRESVSLYIQINHMAYYFTLWNPALLKRKAKQIHLT